MLTASNKSHASIKHIFRQKMLHNSRRRPGAQSDRTDQQRKIHKESGENSPNIEKLGAHDREKVQGLGGKSFSELQTQEETEIRGERIHRTRPGFVFRSQIRRCRL